MTQPLFFRREFPNGKTKRASSSLSILPSIWPEALYTSLLSHGTVVYSIMVNHRPDLNWLHYVCGILMGWNRYHSRYLDVISSRILLSKLHFMFRIRNCVVMVGMSDIRSRKAGNGLKRSKRVLPVWFSRLGIRIKKKRLCHYFLEQL